MRISKYILKHIFSLLFLALALPLSAQEKNLQPDISIENTTFQGISVSADLVGPLQLLIGDYGQVEGSVKANFGHRYFPVVEAGYGKADAIDDVIHLRYATAAPYIKIGGDYNVLRSKDDRYRALAGLRYGFSKYKFDISSTEDLMDPVWQTLSKIDLHDVKASCGWIEALFGIDIQLYGPVRVGWSIRYKLRLHHKEDFQGKSWYVPGYGKQGTSQLGGTFNIAVEI